MARRPKPPERRVLREAEFEEQQPLLRLFVPQLRKDVQIVAETFRGKRFYVLQDPISLQYFRIGETGRSIVAQFDGAKRLGDIHTELREQFAEDAPGFDELSRFVFSLRNANLLVADADTEQFLKRVQKKKRQRALSTATNFLFIRIPLVDPDRFLTKTHPYVSWIFSWPVFFMGLAVVIAALVKVVLHAEELMKPVNAVLAPPNLPLLWVAFVLVKVCHELGHAYSAKHYGAQVHRMGILFLVFVPCFYVDVTPVWGFERKRPKVLVGMAGMMVEVFIAGLAVFLWASLETGPLRSIAFNIIFVASVSTILFNANPFLRFDGYYILSDAIEMPNLRTRSSQYVLHLIKRYILDIRQIPPPVEKSERVGLVLYAIGATIVRTMVVCLIIFKIAGRFFVIGMGIALVTAAVWLLVPTGKAFHYLFISPQTFNVRARATVLVIVGVTLLVLLAGVLGLPQRATAPCVVEADQEEVVRAKWPGFLREIAVVDGQQIGADDIIAVAENDQLAFDLVRIASDIRECEARLGQLRTDPERVAEAQGEEHRLKMLTKEQDVLRQRMDDLTIRSPISGCVIAPGLDKRDETFVQIGDPLVRVASMGSLSLQVVLDEDSISKVERYREKPVRVRFRTRPGETVKGRIRKISPEAMTQAPPRAVTNLAGGPVLIDRSSPEQARTLLPWFKVEVELELDDDGRRQLRLGATGTAKFELESASLAQQVYWWVRKRLKKLQL